MNNEIKPIETKYKGYRFRSRLEARWAVFFDAIGAEWEYEPEGFDLGDGLWYLPDFVLHDVPNGFVDDDTTLESRKHFKKIWIEVKGVMDEESARKIYKFSRMLGKGENVLVVGTIPDSVNFLSDMDDDLFYKHSKREPEIYYYQLGGEWAGGDIDFIGADETGTAGLYGSYKWWSRVGLDWTKTDKAFEKARSARFEHGENG